MNEQPTTIEPQPSATEAAPVWQILFYGIAKPKQYLTPQNTAKSGRVYFYHAFTFYCLIPMFALNLLVVALNSVMPDIFYFQDINPVSVLFALPAQLLLGPVFIAVMATCMQMGLGVTGLASEDDTAPLFNLGWYIGTVYVCLYSWWLGVCVVLASIDAIDRAIEPIFPITMILGLILFLRVLISAYYHNTPPANGKWGKTIIGVVIGAVMFFIASLIIGFVLRYCLMLIFL